MKKNSQFHLMMETRHINKLKDDARDKGVSLAELCRQRLRKQPQLDRIEGKLDRLLGGNQKNAPKKRHL